MKHSEDKQQYALKVCRFLSDSLHHGTITVARAGEVAEKIVHNISLVNHEYDFLNLLKELAKDFQELTALTEEVTINIKKLERQKLELMVKNFVVQHLHHDLEEAREIMEAVMDETVKLPELKKKFQSFRDYVDKIL